MAEQSAFNRKQVEAEAYVQPEGLLDHLNLPPGFVRFIRRNLKTLQITGIILAVIVVTGSLYDSYRTQKRDKAAASLAAAVSLAGDERNAALQTMEKDFSGTPAAQWARIELGHAALRAGDFKGAVAQYDAVRKDINTQNPLFSLLTYGLAQAHAQAGESEAALVEFRALQKTFGYEGLGYYGVGSVFEVQGKADRALAVYEEYSALLMSRPGNESEQQQVDEKITRLKALM